MKRAFLQRTLLGLVISAVATFMPANTAFAEELERETGMDSVVNVTEPSEEGEIIGDRLDGFDVDEVISDETLSNADISFEGLDESYMQLPEVRDEIYNAKPVDSPDGTETRNNGYHNYDVTASVPGSYLYRDGSSYVRVEALSDSNLLIETYSSDFKLTDRKKLAFELPIFGGFYHGSSAMYVMYGQQNNEESNDTEVVRIVKYDLSWNRLGSVSYYGVNTTSPFSAGSSSFAEYGNRLYVRTCHRMYTSADDGLRHQANMTFIVNTDSMTSVNAYYWVSYINGGAGYVSHSFNQFIRVEGNQVLAVDHGDAYPRWVSLVNFGAAAGGNSLTPRNYKGVLGIPGEIGANYTGVSVGGFEVSGSNTLTAVNRVAFDDNYQSNDVRNISLLVTDTGNGGISEVKLTSDTENGNVTNGTPYLVRLSDNLFAVMWSIQSKSSGWLSDSSNRFAAVLVDIYGNKRSDVRTFNGYLSDCTPVFDGSKLVWYVTGDKSYDSVSSPCFFELGISSSGSGYDLTLNVPLKRIALSETSLILEANEEATLEVAFTPEVTTVNRAVTWSSSNKAVAVVDASGKVTARSAGTARITARLNDKSAVCDVKVTKTTMVFDEPNLIIDRSGTSLQKITVSITPDDSKYKNATLFWSSSDTSVVSLSRSSSSNNSYSYESINGNPVELRKNIENAIRINGAGKATITARTSDGKISAVCNVTVRQQVTGVSLNYRRLTISGGDTQQLTATVSPSNASNKGFTWSSSNEAVATVDQNGLVTGRSAGVATITVKTLDQGKTASCTVTVKKGTGVVPSSQNDDHPMSADQVEAFVSRLYVIILERNPEPAGLTDWTNQLLNRTIDGASCATGIVMSQEYINKNDPDEVFVTKLYRTFLNRQPDEAGLRSWVETLKQGYSRKYVLRGFVNSDEFTEICESYGINRGTIRLTAREAERSDANLHVDRDQVTAYVTRLYNTILGRAPEAAGLSDWVDRIMRRENDAANVAKIGFFESREYTNKNRSNAEFVTDCYRALMGREPDASGFNYWVGKLDRGEMSRAKVIEHGFGHSNEFTEILREYGLRMAE